LFACGAFLAAELFDDSLGGLASGPPVPFGDGSSDVFELDFAGDRAVGAKRDLAREGAAELPGGDRPRTPVDVRDRREPSPRAVGVLPCDQVA
jgi:hypothetical protein